MNYPVTPRQKELLEIIYEYIKDTGYPPTFEEMRSRLVVSSNQSVMDLLGKLKVRGFIKRNPSGARSITILPLGYEVLSKQSLVPFLGITSAGPTMEMLEISGEWEETSSDVTRLKEDVFLLKILGDSMINAGIDDGDAVLVQSVREFVSGDIVFAEIGDEGTVKRFISEDKPPYVYLKPENPNHKNILFTDEVRLKGKVISVLKSERWESVK